MAKQTRAWEFDLEEGILDAGRLARVVVNPLTPLSFKQESDTEFPGHGGEPADRQLAGSMPRPADRDRRDLGRHPGADAGALRREGGDPGLHDAGVEGRPGAGEVWIQAGKPERPGGGASMTCGAPPPPYRLQRAPTRPGGGPAETWG